MRITGTYFSTEPCPVCGCFADGLSNRFLCTACDAVWTSGEPQSVICFGPVSLLSGFPLRPYTNGSDGAES